MQRILEPLETARTTGVYMTRGDGHRYRVHPIFAAFIGDYPEQILSTGSIYGECPTCNVDRGLLGDYDSRNTNQLRDLRSVRTIFDTFDQDPAGFLRACTEARIKPIIKPFWINLPYAHIFHSITPDILHQIYQGIVKRLIGWIIKAVGSEEVDARCHRLPPNITSVPSLKAYHCCPVLLAGSTITWAEYSLHSSLMCLSPEDFQMCALFGQSVRSWTSHLLHSTLCTQERWWSSWGMPCYDITKT